MKRRLIALLTICVLAFSLTGCGSQTTYQDISSENNTLYYCMGGYFVTIAEWGNGADCEYRIVYAQDTKVKYFIFKEGYGKGITPLYNADGTLQIYEGEL